MDKTQRRLKMKETPLRFTHEQGFLCVKNNNQRKQRERFVKMLLLFEHYQIVENSSHSGGIEEYDD